MRERESVCVCECVCVCVGVCGCVCGCVWVCVGGWVGHYVLQEFKSEVVFPALFGTSFSEVMKSSPGMDRRISNVVPI